MLTLNLAEQVATDETPREIAAVRLPRACVPGQHLLILQNPGRMSRNWIAGMISAAQRLGIAHRVLELGEVWAGLEKNRDETVRNLNALIAEHRIGATLSYGYNGVIDIPVDAAPPGCLRSFFEIRGVTQLLVWIDHPQWHGNRIALSPQASALMRSANCHHFLKNSAHALELERICGWPNCRALPPAMDARQLTPAEGITPKYDIVAISGGGGGLADWMKPLLESNDPQVSDILARAGRDVQADLDHLWETEAPADMRPQLQELGRRWVEMKLHDPTRAAIRYFARLVAELPGACWWLTLNSSIYFKACEALWKLGNWQRTFYLAYLARYFRVAAFGGDFSEYGVAGGGWVNFAEMPAAFAQGRLALNIPAGHDEEGLNVKPFEIAASGVAMLHHAQRGLEDCFEPDREVAVFQTPREAREMTAELLEDAPRRQAMSLAARRRLEESHSWESRLVQMFDAANLPLDAFRKQAA